MRLKSVSWVDHVLVLGYVNLWRFIQEEVPQRYRKVIYGRLDYRPMTQNEWHHTRADWSPSISDFIHSGVMGKAWFWAVTFYPGYNASESNLAKKEIWVNADGSPTILSKG